MSERGLTQYGIVGIIRLIILRVGRRDEGAVLDEKSQRRAGCHHSWLASRGIISQHKLDVATVPDGRQGRVIR